MKTSLKLMIALLIAAPVAAFAQETPPENDANELNIIEMELEKGKSPEPSPGTAAAQPAAPGTDAAKMPADKPAAQRSSPQAAEPIDFAGLGRLSAFSDVSVIQRRYLPKTERFQLFGGLSMITNNPFFNSYGLVVKGSYFFTETLGVELNYATFSTSEAKATQELRGINNVATGSLVTTKGFKIVDAMFVPIYGKMTWFNKRIIPYDLYFSTGYGMTSTSNDLETKDQSTLHLATGQMFALSKASAFRWDFSWNFFKAKGVDQAEGSYNNLFLTVGWSWFFPEAGYR